MPKLSKNYIIVIALSVVSLIIGGTFFAISRSNSGQKLASNSTQNSSSLSNSSQSSVNSQSSNSVFSSIYNSSSQNSSSFSGQGFSSLQAQAKKFADTLRFLGVGETGLEFGSCLALENDCPAMGIYNLKPVDIKNKSFISSNLIKGDFYKIEGLAIFRQSAGDAGLFDFTEVSKIEKISTPQSTSSNPKIQPLVADETHDVVIIDECDLAIKYPKKANYIEISGDKSVDQNDEYYTNKRTLTIEKNDYSDYSLVNLVFGGNYKYKTNFNCSEKKFEKLTLSILKRNKFENLTILDEKSLLEKLNIKYQQNSLAPSTPSVKLEKI